MADVPDKWKVCALCRHLESVVSDQDIEGIINTEYTVFHCRKLDAYRYEQYLLTPPAESTEEMEAGNREEPCPYWEAWEQENAEAYAEMPECDGDVSDSDMARLLRDLMDASGD
ncbi:hypothetical protein IJT93_06010 [bacterium]|nr:hypothetical protein [bacterium]